MYIYIYIYTCVCVYTWWDNFGYPTRQSHKWAQMFKCRVRSDWTARHLRQHWSCCTRAWTGAQVVGDPECGCLPEIPCVSFWAFSKMIRLQRFTWGLLMLHVVTGAEFRLFFSWGDSCEVRPHTGQETTTRRAHREHDWGQGTWHPRRTTENECHRMSKSIKNL